ncbi:T9SS sorting signal type C domain-containing protein [Flavobacterium sp.]|uniref:T9SS sorting signal type C domain-containing protein n=1 Tax=Flavobacterium sp. TaxID=239 RepID=UPI002FD8DF15
MTIDYPKTQNSKPVVLRTIASQIALVALTVLFNIATSFAQCSNYQVYESLGTSLPTSGGTWAATSMTYGTTSGTARTGVNYAIFNANGDILETPQIANPSIFSFWYKRSGTSTGSPQFTIETSLNNSTWTSQGTVTPTGTYQQFTLNLAALSLTNVYVRIRDTRASGAAERYVDDISWTSTASNTVIPTIANCSQTITCGTTYSFSDSGTTSDTYNASEDYTITFTPSVGTNKIQMIFSTFDTESYDGMVIYNGPTTASPIISSGLSVGSSSTNCPAGSYYGTTSPGTIVSTDATGAITIRFRSDSTTNNPGWLASVSCISVSPCVAPASQASAFSLGTITSSSIPSSFSGTADGYLVISSTTNSPPSQPVNGTTYSSANIATLGAGLTFVQTGSSTSIAESGLSGNTKYYYFIYAYNNTSCSGGPIYNTSGALTGNGTTCPAVPNSVATASISTSGFSLNWAIPTGGSASAVTYTVQVTTDSGYTTNVAGSPFTIAAPTVTLNLTGLSSGTKYYYRILASNGCSSTYVTGNVTTVAVAPSNNQCANATSLPCGTTNLSGTTVGALSYVNGTGCTMADYGVWYTFVGDGNSNTIAATTTSYDIEMSIASGSCGSLTNITCQDIAVSSGTETYTFTATLGVTYYVYIAYYSSGGTTTGPFTISRTCTTPFNPCTSIPNISACSSTTNTTIASGTGVYGSSTCGWSTPGQEQIYTFTPSTSGNYFIQQISSFDYINYLFKPVSSGCGSSGWTCIDALWGAGTTPVFALTAGIQYYILLDPESSSGGSISFVLNCPITTPANDNCSGAISLTVNPTLSCATNTSGTTLGATQSQTACSGTADDDVWYKFVATNPSHTVTVTPGSLSDIVLQIFSGSCGSLTSVDCVDDTYSSNEATILSGLTIGNTYYIRVHSYSSGSGQGTFTICVTTNVPCTSGTGTGTTSLGCPSVTSGGLGLNGADPAPIDCLSNSSCVDLEATYLRLGQTTSYSVEAIPYAPPYQFNCLANAVSVNSDDIWSPVVNLPFNFCFYGNTYNSCLIGSNGMLSFNTANAGGATGYAFSNSLPSTTGALFANTIYGVYHDIDPSVGGEVGWELITLNTGCRALVASWSDVPMFSTNSILYSGMMVLYENTNVIEVYIKEKNIDDYNVSPWNGGNAIVGVQNAAGTQAVVAPGRNGLDTNWAVTNEAWRFVPAGTSITSIKWYEGAGTAGTVVGTTDTINVCPASTTTYTAEVTYTLCNGTTLKETDQTTVTVTGSKVWNGSVDTDWNKANNWTPVGVPTNTDCVVIPNVTNDPIISGTSYNAYGYNLTVLNGGNLQLNSANNITITDFVKVATGGTFTIKNSGNLVQINNSAVNTGNITMERTTSIRQLDYVYWSSPVANFNVSNITAPIASGLIYKWNTTVANNNGGQGNWQSATGNTMLPGTGYIVGGPASFSNTAYSTLLGTFNGVPNNGIITTIIYRGNDQNTAYHTGTNGTEINNYSDNWNLLGNPYPSSIKGSQFLLDNNTKIMGQLRLWTHGTLPAIISSPFYNTFIYNYNPGDYFTYNFTGTSCCPAAGADLFVGAAQGFFVQMVDGAASSTTVSFNNNLRNESYSNTTFYKTANPNAANTNIIDIERNRIWLDLLDVNKQSDRALIGYIEGATMEADSFFDAGTLAPTQMAIYSMIGNDKFVIQGRSIPFNPNDIVPLGVKITTPGKYTIAIGAVDGLFENPNKNIFLEDTETKTIQNLREGPYTFDITAGTNNTRFRLRYKYPHGNGNNSKALSETVLVTAANKQISIQSSEQNIQSVILYDLVGREVYTADKINKTEVTINNAVINQQALIVKIMLSDGTIVTKRVMN